MSVVIPLFNGASVLEAAIASVLRQQFDDWELLIVDDGSSDESSQVASTWAQRDPRIRLIRNPANLGIARTYNVGIRASKGPLVLILHQDCSLVGDDWIGRAVGSFDGPDCIAVVGSPLHDITEMAGVEKLFWIIRSHIAAIHSGDSTAVEERLFSENKCDLFRKEFLLKLGAFDESLVRGGEDQVLALRIRDNGLRVALPPGLLFRASLGTDRTIWQNLRKERGYGRQIRGVLFGTGLRAVRRTGQGRLDPWLVNRLSIAVWVSWTVAFLVAGLVLDRPLVAVLAIAGPLFRAGQLWARAIRARRAYQLKTAEVLVIGPLGLVADLAYLGGALLPPWRRASGSPA